MTPLPLGNAFNRMTAERVSNILCVLGSGFLTIYGVKSLLDGLTAYALTLFAFAAATMGSYLIYRVLGNWRSHRNFIVFGFSSLYLFLLASGGEENTGLLWCYAYPLLMFCLIGPVIGARIVMVMLAASLLILFVPEWVGATHGYSDNMKYRFVGSMLFVVTMGYFMERSRLLAQEASERANESLRQLVRIDELTGTYNRRGIKQKVQLELHRVARDKSELSLVLCDIDLFKQVNDRYGHDVGDAALKHISRLLTETVRVTDVVGRWGGEEFLILLPNTRLSEGYQLIERVRERIAAETLEVNGHELKLSMSCGICSTRFFSRFDDLVKAADVSLYEAKAQGRNCTRPKIQQAG